MIDYPDHPRIVSDPAIMVGKPTIRGTRITVELVLSYLSGGGGIESVLEAYPHLEREDVLAALAFAASHISRDEAVSV